jgi:hypothetical protein
MFEDLKNIKSGTRELREFGVTIGAILIVFADVAMFRGKAFGPYILGIGIVFALLGLMSPAVLKPFQKMWMGLGIVLGFFVSRIILSIIFFGIITPIGLLMKLFGKDILDERIEKSKVSYWHQRPVAARLKASYENQY